MNLTELVMAGQSKITRGCSYLWSCFGKNARYIDFGISEEQDIASAVFDAETQEVYCVEIFSLDETQVWRWIDERYRNAFLKECRDRNIDPSVWIDNIKYQNVDATEALLLINQLISTSNIE